VLICASPITGGFQLNTTMMMHNGGKLPFTLTWEVKWDGPYDTDPCYDVAPTKDLSTLQRPPWSWDMEVYKRNATGIFGPYGTTQTEYKPCNDIIVKQHVDFKQPTPGVDTWQKDWQCKWIKIWVTFKAEDIYEEVSSWTWGTTPPTVP